MRIKIIFLLILFSLFPLNAIGNDSEIIVSGTGISFASPDFAKLDINIEYVSKKAETAVERTASLYEKVVVALEEIGITSENINTINYYVNQHWEMKQNREREFIGYKAIHRISVRIPELNQVGKIIDASVSAGVTQIGGLKFESSNTDSMQHAALAMAVRQARKRAETMAEAAGGHLGSLIELSTESSFRSSLAADMSISELNVGTQLSPGDNIMRVNVQGKWKFIEKK